MLSSSLSQKWHLPGSQAPKLQRPCLFVFTVFAFSQLAIGIITSESAKQLLLKSKSGEPKAKQPSKYASIEISILKITHWITHLIVCFSFSHLSANNWEIRKLAAENLGSISYNVHGKEAAIEADSIPPLCDMLGDDIYEVKSSAVRALASLAQLKEGKIQIYDLDKLN